MHHSTSDRVHRAAAAPRTASGFGYLELLFVWKMASLALFNELAESFFFICLFVCFFTTSLTSGNLKTITEAGNAVVFTQQLHHHTGNKLLSCRQPGSTALAGELILW